MKERRKMFILLGVGAVLAIGFFALLNVLNIGTYFAASLGGLFVFVAIVCYPLAFVYGKHRIIDVFHSISIGDRQPFRIMPGKARWKPIFTGLNFIFAAFTTVCFGWAYGTYNAYKKLQMLKSFQVK